MYYVFILENAGKNEFVREIPKKVEFMKKAKQLKLHKWNKQNKLAFKEFQTNYTFYILYTSALEQIAQIHI